jgi:hypothetical protein
MAGLAFMTPGPVLWILALERDRRKSKVIVVDVFNVATVSLSYSIFCNRKRT